ncbi:MAG: ABC transporter permease [Nitrososphaerota archaeon]
MSFSTLVWKELRELLAEKTILIGVLLMPLILFPLLGLTMSAGFSSAGRAQPGFEAAVLDRDGGWASHELLETLGRAGVRLKIAPSGSDLREILEGLDSRLLIIIPEGFSQNITNHRQASIQLYYRLEKPSIIELETLSNVLTLVSQSSAIFGERLASGEGINVRFYKSPFAASEFIVYQGQVLGGVYTTVLQPALYLSLIIPIGIFIIAITAGNVSATSVALEKEAKTLEILLTLPIHRLKLLASKLLGSVILAALGGASFMIGFLIYFQGIMSMMRQPLGEGVQPGAEMLATVYSLSAPVLLLLGLIVIISLALTLSIGILAGVIAGDVRGGQQLASLLLSLLFLPPLILQLRGGLGTLDPASRAIMLVNPVTHMFLALESVTASDIPAALTHILVTLVYLVLLLGVAAWLFSGERLISLRVKLGRRGNLDTV